MNLPPGIIPTTPPFIFAYLICAALSVGLLVWLIMRAVKEGGRAYAERFTSSSTATLRECLIFMPAGWLLMMKVACAVVGGVLGFLLGMPLQDTWQKAIPILLFGVPLFFVPDLMVKRFYAQRLKKFRNQMIDGLQILANSMKSGLSLEQAIREMVKRSEDPLRGEFYLVLQQIDLGASLERALENLVRRMPVQDLELFVFSINAVYSYGEGIVEISEKAANLIRERTRIEQRINTLTAEGRAQTYILCGAPIFLIIVLYFLDPNLIKLLFTTFTGIVLLMIVAVLNTVGFFVIKKIITIEV